MNAPLTAPQQEHAYLSRLGERVRAWRTEHGMTRKALSLACGVSERYLAQLESGRGNISVLLLRKVARAMGVTVEHLVREEESAARSGRIALIGLRGAGKSTLGEKLAQSLGLAFVELDREVEKEAGAKLGEVFAMYGLDAYRRFERRALERVLNQNERAVIAAGGMRPFKGRSAALDEIRRLLADRERLYGRADVTLDTSGKSLRQSLAEIRKAIQ